MSRKGWIHAAAPRALHGGSPFAPPAPLRAFTILELLVVIAIIALILVLGVPAFNTLSRDSRFAQARQLLAAEMSRAALISTSERSLIAVRAAPAEWLFNAAESEDPAATRETLVGRQALAAYRYVTGSTPPVGHASDSISLQPGDVFFLSYFKQMSGLATILPEEIWVAPAEALQPAREGRFDGDGVLRGTIDPSSPDRFVHDPTPTSREGWRRFLNADDFLVVFDPEQGVRTTAWPPGSERARPSAWRLFAYDPETVIGDPENRGWECTGTQWNNALRDFEIRYQRYHFSGVVLYRRDVLAGLGADAQNETEIQQRRDVLVRYGEAYSIRRFGGNLLRAEPSGSQQ